MDTTRKPLEYYLGLQYPLNLVADPDGGYVVIFPDLPGCLTQVETLDELASMADEARVLWIETEYESGHDIPLPSYPEEFSGKFNLRLPRSLHRSLAEAAEREGVSLNQYVVHLLARGDSQARLERQVQQIAEQVAGLQSGLRFEVDLAPSGRARWEAVTRPTVKRGTDSAGTATGATTPRGRRRATHPASE
jgi:predicted RNase H-like HicB family nuclease